MANKKIRATAELFLNTKDARKDAQIFLNDLKGKLQDIENAADKMTVFKDMVNYIAQVDKALAALKANNKDAFAHMFDGLDTNLRKQLEGIFGVDGSKLGQLNVLRDSLNDLSPQKTKIDEIRKFANEINNLFISIGKDSPFKNIDKEFSGRTNASHIQKLSDALNNFATVWKNLNAQLSQGFNFGGTPSPSATGGPLSEIDMLIDNIEKKNKELMNAKERLDKTLEDFDNKKNGISDDYKINLTEESIKELTLEYDRLQTELENADASSAGFYITLTKLIEASLRLKRAFKDVTDDQKLKEAFMNMSAGGGTGDPTLYARLSRYANSKDPMNKDVERILDRGDLQNKIDSNNYLINDLRVSNDINAVIQKRITLQDRLIEKIRQHSDLYGEFMFAEDGEADALDGQLYAIEEEIAALAGYEDRIDGISKLMRDLCEADEMAEESLRSLYEMLGMETPEIFEARLKSLLEESRAAFNALQNEMHPGAGGHRGGGGSGTGGGSGSGSAPGDGSGGTVTAEVDFTSLENTIRTEIASISDKLDGNTFKVEVVKDHADDIRNSINDILGAINKISEHYRVDKNQADIDNMKKNLLQLLDVVNTHNAGRTSGGAYQGQELGVSLMSDGGLSVNYGDEGSVSWSHIAESLLANLNKTLIADIHTHPLHELLDGQTFASDMFSGSSGDLGAFRFSKLLGAKVAGMLTGNVLRLLNVDALKFDTMSRFRSELAKVENEYIDSGLYSKYIKRSKNGKMILNSNGSLEDIHKVSELVESMMYDAFERVGYSRKDVDENLFKKYNLTDDAQLTELASRLVQLTYAAEQAEPPISRLCHIIADFGGDVSTDKASELLQAYNKGEMKASEVFNRLVNNPNFKVNESAVQSLLNINNARQSSSVETLLASISSILSNINTLVGNIEARTRQNNEQQINGAIQDLLDLRSGVVNDGLNSGVQSIYNNKDATRYRYDDVENRAAHAVNEFLDLWQRKSNGGSIAKTELKEALLLIEKFKTALTYIQDLGKQRELLTGGPTAGGDYIDPSSGEVLGSVLGGKLGSVVGSYDQLYSALTNAEKLLDPMILQLIDLRDSAFAHPDAGDNFELKTTLEHLSIAINDLNSEISSLRTELSRPKNDIGALTKSDIATAFKEGMFAKEFASGYKKMEFHDFVDYDDDVDMWVSNITGELFNSLDEALDQFDKYFSDFYMSIDQNDRFFGTKEDTFNRIIEQQSNADDNNFATVIVDAINDQTGKIVQAIKVILPDRISSNTTNGRDLIDEEKIADAFEAIAIRAMSWSDDHNSTPRSFFNEILRQDGNSSVYMDDALSNALKTLGMMTKDGVPKFTVAKEGMRNLGVAIAENFALPARPSVLDQASKLSPMLKEAVELGAAIPRIIAHLSDEDRVFELQTRMKGENIRGNSDFMNATTEQIDGLLHTFEVMSKVGLYPDFIGDNVLFDKQKGFSLVDIESENIVWGRNLDTADGMGEWFLDYVRKQFPGVSKDFSNRFRERMALPAEQRLVNENTVGKVGSNTSDSHINVSQDIANLDLLLNRVREVAGEIRNLATEVSGIIQSVSDPFKQSQKSDEVFEVDSAEIDRIKAIYDAEDESSKKAIDDLALFYKEYSDLKNTMHQAFPVADEENPTDAERAKVLDAFAQIKQKELELTDKYLDTDEDIQGIRKLKAEMIGLQAVIQSLWNWDSNKQDYQKRFGISDEDIDFFYNLIGGAPINDIDTEINKEYSDKEFEVFRHASHYFTDVMNDIDSGMDDFLLTHAKSLSNISKETNVTEELAPLDKLKSQLLEVKEAVEAKTAAFEQERLIVDSVVDAEIFALQALEAQLAEVLAQINLVDEGFKKINNNTLDGTANGQSYAGAIDGEQFDVSGIITNITGIVDNLRDCMQRIAEVFGSNMMSFEQTLVPGSNEANISDEIEKLDRLKTILAEVKNAIAAKTKAFIDEGNIVGQVVGKEISALKHLSDIVDNIVPKINSLVEGLKSLKDHGIDVKTTGVTNGGDTGSQQPEDPFKKNLYNKTNALNKYRDDIKEVEYVSQSLRDELDALAADLLKISNQGDLDGWTDRFNNLNDNVKSAQSVFEQENNGKINLYQKELTNSYNKLSLPQREKLFDEYSETIVLLNKQKQAVKEGHAVELDGIKQITAALQEKINKQIESNKAVKDAEKEQKKNSKFGNTAMINASAKYNTLNRIVHDDQFADSSTIMAKWDEYVEKYKELEKIQDELSQKPSVTKDDEIRFKAAKDACNDYAKSLNKMLNDSMKLSGERANKEAYMLGGDFNYDDESARKSELEDFVKTIDGANLASLTFKKGFKEAMFEVNNGDGTITSMTAKFTAARNEIVAVAGDTKKAQTAFGAFWDELKGKFKSIGAYLVASFSFHEVWSVIRQGIQYVREIDSALTELKKVTDETDASYANFLQDMSKTGGVIGATVKDLTIMASEWARLGYSMEEAGKLAESTAILLNVSEFQDATAASEALISTMQAFQYTADESQHVVDVLNEVGFKMPMLYSNI